MKKKKKKPSLLEVFAKKKTNFKGITIFLKLGKKKKSLLI